jgi:hypothetical protein
MGVVVVIAATTLFFPITVQSNNTPKTAAEYMGRGRVDKNEMEDETEKLVEALVSANGICASSGAIN